MGRALTGIAFVVAGLLHFVKPRAYESIMPDYLPAHRELVMASGVAEVAGGAGLLFERTRRPAGWWLIATLVAIFPANVHMALHPDRYPRIPRLALWLRLPLQGVIVGAVWCAGPAAWAPRGRSWEWPPRGGVRRPRGRPRPPRVAPLRGARGRRVPR